MEIDLATQFATLGHDRRLAVFQLLMRRYPQAVPAGEIADVLGLKANTASAYLSALREARLIASERRGTSLLYRIDMGGAQALTTGLFQGCCRARPDLCLPGMTSSEMGETRTMDDKTYTVLFICSGNSARSVMAEVLLRDLGEGRFNAHSAGVAETSELNPFTVELLKAKGHDVSALRSKNIAEYNGADAPALDFVFTVCDDAANEQCPAWPGQPISAHWGMPDPVRAQGTEAERRLAFQQAYGVLKNRIQAFAALPVETLDRVALQHRLDDIGREAADA